MGWNITCDSSTPLNTSTGVATCTTSQLPVNTTAPYNVVTATYTPDGSHLRDFAVGGPGSRSGGHVDHRDQRESG